MMFSFLKKKPLFTDTPYVFFDVDGVLNCENDWRTKRFFVNDNCLAVLKQFVEWLKKVSGQTPKLIICSTWRIGMDNKNKTDASAMSILEQKLASVGLFIADSTPVSKKSRQEEIEYYIRRHNVKCYVIIDDDNKLYPRPEEIRLYVPDYRTGLTNKDLKSLQRMMSE